MTFDDLLKAAKSGDPRAQFRLGVMLYEGDGVEQDYEQAAECFRDAAARGHPYAQYNLGAMFYDGIGIEKDLKMAVRCFEDAASQGDVKAQYRLGNMYFEGDGVEKEPERAAHWFQEAAKEAHPYAQYNLGLSYHRGHGVERNDAIACFWLLIARAHPGVDQDFKDNINEILEEAEKFLLLSTAEGVERTAREWCEQYDAKLKQRRKEDEKRQTVGRPQQRNEDERPQRKRRKFPFASPPEPDEGANVFDKVCPSGVVVAIDGERIGSGVIVNQDVVATNWHVAKNGDEIVIFKEKDGWIDQDTPFVASVVHKNEKEDFCLLKVEGLNGAELPIRPYDTLKPGESVYTLSSPWDLPMRITNGMISALVSADGKSRVIQTNAEFTHGSSGGGLFDANGNLVGILTFGDPRSGGIRYAIPADLVSEFEA